MATSVEIVWNADLRFGYRMGLVAIPLGDYLPELALVMTWTHFDRTQEFQSIWKTYKKSSSSSSLSLSSYSPLRPQSEFSKRANKINFGIHRTSQDLVKLAEVANRRSVFDDPTREIQVLSEVIKQDITALNSDVSDLQLLSQNESGNDDSPDDTSMHFTVVVDILENRLMSATDEFKEVLYKRTEKLKADETRRQLYHPGSSTESTNPFVLQPPLATKSSASLSRALPPWVNGASSSSTLYSRKQADGESQPLLQQQQQMIPLQDPYMQSTAEAFQNIKSTTHEISNTFIQLATMLSEQGEVAIRIDEDMERTLANVDVAQNQLVRSLDSISSNGWLTIKIFFVLIVFLMFFLLFAA